MFIRDFIFVGAAVALCAGTAACSSSSSSGTGPDSGSGPVAMCSAPGQATPGPKDDHCATAAEDGGPLLNKVTLACDAALPDAGAESCAYGPTEYGHEADDDDCKYHVSWTSTPICDVPGAVTFTVVVTHKSDGSPATGANLTTEVFATTPGDDDAATYCDDQSGHPSPNLGVTFKEGPPGTYVGPIEFDTIPASKGTPGAWTVRFHLYGDCTDLPTAPHGHVAFHVTAP